MDEGVDTNASLALEHARFGIKFQKPVEPLGKNRCAAADNGGVAITAAETTSDQPV